jgi:hypothetical protein
MTVEWKELLGTSDPSLRDIQEAKELAQSMNTWALAGYGDDEPEPVAKKASAPSAPVTSETLNDRYRDLKLETENLKEALGEAATKHGPESESVRRAQAKLVAAQAAEWGAKEAVSNSVMHDAVMIDSLRRARREVEAEIEEEQKEWLKSINQTVGKDSELATWMTDRFNEKKATPEQIEKRVQERAAARVANIQRITKTVKDSPLYTRPDFGDAPPLREVNAPVINAQEGYAQFLEKKGDPIAAAEVRAGRLPARK